MSPEFLSINDATGSKRDFSSSIAEKNSNQIALKKNSLGGRYLIDNLVLTTYNYSFKYSEFKQYRGRCNMDNIEGLVSIDDAVQTTPAQNLDNHKQYGNVGLANLLGMLGMVKKFVRAEGNYIWDNEGTRYIDFLAGYGAVSLGHN
ncbi:MAG: hypothetical protein ACFFB3_20800, partial [Candidatus Hodarchaeota archaeon]